ncbi:hypothetical protein HGI30_15960 [Paenibacillus albicereus]|uniref:Uncharacterized protein n=1 Tax=Paenibacillus albicereus TaxID=2726185 RepID=A0A6H2GZT2_9BACL|nr:hypothetical protein [Paenibacillus albicereus]QJC52915.1 hypothetical protein HGI30_15960 [Paenibacillus albicereus]
MSNEQQPIRVPAPGRVVSGPAKGVVGRVFAVEGDSVSIQLGSGVIIVHRRDVEQDDSDPMEDSVPAAQPARMTAEQIAEISEGLRNPTLFVQNGYGWANSLLAEVQRQQGEINIHVAEIDRMTRKWACEVTATKRLQAENDQLRESVQNWADAAAGWESQAAQLRQKLGEAVEKLEWYGDETEEEDSVYYCQPRGYEFMPSEVQVDGGQRAREILTKLKGDRADG